MSGSISFGVANNPNPNSNISASVMQSANNATLGIINSQSPQATNIYLQAHNQMMMAWQNVESSTSALLIDALTVGLATYQQKMLKDQLNYEKDVANQKSELVTEQINKAKENIKNNDDDYNKNFKPNLTKYSKLIKDSASAKYNPNYEFTAGRMSTSKLPQFTGLKQKILETTSPHNFGALVYKISKLQAQKIQAVNDGASIGYVYENEKIEDFRNNNLGRIERYALQGQNVKTQSDNNINLVAMVADNLQPDVAGATDAYLGGLGNLAGSLVNLFNGNVKWNNQANNTDNNKQINIPFAQQSII